ncbi:MAG: hypothetical protein WAU00_18765, partial [Caldilinea sp.]
CYASTRELFDACKAFVDRINTEPFASSSAYGPNWNWTLTSRNSWFQSSFTLGFFFFIFLIAFG